MSFPLVTLVILDGWGIAPPGPGNAVALASTPVFDALASRYRTTRLAASGPAVGLPNGQMGNSEVGHLTIGSGRILFQDLVRVDRACTDGSLLENDALGAAFARARARGGAVHLLGLVSEGGVHSHVRHLRALLDLAARAGMAERTWIHAFTDGRDVSPQAAATDLVTLPGERVATLVGRYYAMDRDSRWERTERAVDAIVSGIGADADDPVAAIRASYGQGITDEFVEPVVLRGRPRLDRTTDTVIFFNFRPDRGRQLSERLGALGVDLTTMTRYRDDFAFPVAFAEQEVRDTLAETLAGFGARQLHAAETEKYAHVTYFFNGGVEKPWPGEERILVPSPREVPSYDLAPEMSAAAVADKVAGALSAGHRFAVVNFANADMVGHTGKIPAVIRAVEEVDRALGIVVAATAAVGGVCVVTADHGNAETMLAADGVSPYTAHTTNPVPLIVTDEHVRLRAGGGLVDLAPTVLDLLGIPVPAAMTGTAVFR
ncbi:MAG: 2,3-bisphosphoglycerate-independent phosphoglycerate mutase [Gaiella sp.]